MPFPNPPHPDILQWDRNACGATTTAQLLYMGGKLQYPFDTAAFDRRIKRQTGQPVDSTECIRLITNVLPVTLHRFSHDATEDLLNEETIRRALRRLGYTKRKAREYLSGPVHRRNQEDIRHALQLEKELGNRYHKRVCPDSSRYVKDFLQRGAVVAAGRRRAKGDIGHAVLLIPRHQQSARTPLALYDPRWGLERITSIESLITQKVLELDESGFMAYMMA